MQEVHLVCAHEHLFWLVDLLKERLRSHEDTDVLDYGHTHKRLEGHIVVVSDGLIDEALLTFLEQHPSVLDSIVLTIGQCDEDAYPFGLAHPPVFEEEGPRCS